MQTPRSAAKARSAPASNASSDSPLVKKKAKKLRKKQALLQQEVTGATEQNELTMERKPRRKRASEPGAAGSTAGLSTDNTGQSVPVKIGEPEEVKASKQAETGGVADVNNADSMPGIPGASTGAVTWRELDKRTDVKRGRFSQTEKETLLEAIKVRSCAC